MTYTEDLLVEQPAINLFESMGWETAVCWDEVFGAESDFGRETRADVVLFNVLRRSLKTINPSIDPAVLEEAIDTMARDRSSMSPIAANEEIYLLLKQGYRYIDNSDDGEDTVVRYIDWGEPENNDFRLCSQMWITGDIENRRPDLLGFVNGLPLVFIELKTSHKQLINAYKENLKDYRSTIPQLFHYNQIILLSNGIKSRIGTVSSEWEHFSEWKKIASENEPRKVSLEVAIRGTCDKSRLLDLVENFTLYVRKKQTIKILAKYHQYLGVNQALYGLQNIRERQGQLGVFWHTQGSGKSFSMVFFTQKAFRKYTGNWTFVVITDRTDLDEQIYKTFNSVGILNEVCQASSGAELRQLLSEDHRFVFTLIQKFKADQDQAYPLLSERDDIIVITDEAHRSQYDTLAMNMRKAMPNAGFMAFTGTPLLADGEQKTKEVFGDYVSVYNFADAVDDGATLPLYYENRVPEVSLNREDLGDEILELLDDADLTDEQQSKLETEFGRAYHIITRDDRLDTIANDLVNYHINREPFSGGLSGKAMMVSIDKATAIRMYDKVQSAWEKTLGNLRIQQKQASGSKKEKLGTQIAYMESTDMAVVVSGAQNDYERMEKKGLDYKTHRERMVKEDLDEKFKDPDDPLRIVFVCAMWLTGFDAPGVSTLYLDKPLKNHTLMQTIARANRVYSGKPCGQIVDYINIFGALQKALGLYGGGTAEEGSGGGGSDVDSPANDKQELLDALTQAMGELKGFLAERKISLQAIIDAPSDNFQKLQLLDDASDELLEPANKDHFISFVRQINRIFKAILPDSCADRFVPERVAINIIYKQMREKSGLTVDDEDVLDVVRMQVNELLDESIETIRIESNLPDPVNIAGIDFDALAEMVSKVNKPKPSDAEKLKNLIARKLSPMVAMNKSRRDLQEKFKELVDEYNLGAYTAEEFFHKLSEFIHALSEEETRTVREGLSEEEMAIFDLLSRDIPLADKERAEVKTIARELTEKMQEVLVLDWRKKQRTKARVRSFIEDTLDRLPEVYDEDLWPKACDEVFLHVYDKYPGQGENCYH